MRTVKNTMVVLFILGFVILGVPASAPFSFGQDPGAEPSVRSANGTVESVDWTAGKIVVNVYGDTGNADAISFIVSDDSVLTRGSDELGLSDIDQGDQVEIQYIRTSEGLKVVRLNDTNMANAF